MKTSHEFEKPSVCLQGAQLRNQRGTCEGPCPRSLEQRLLCKLWSEHTPLHEGVLEALGPSPQKATVRLGRTMI